MRMMKQHHDEKTVEHVTLLHNVLQEELKDTIRALEDYMAHAVVTLTIYGPFSSLEPLFSAIVECRRASFNMVITL